MVEKATENNQIDIVPVVTKEQYRAIDHEDLLYRWEYDGTNAIRLSGASDIHAIIQARIITKLVNFIDKYELSCVTTTSEYYLTIETEDKTTIHHPDVTLLCSNDLTTKKYNLSDMNPILTVEVLSKSSINMDTVVKLERYAKIPSLRFYLIVSQYDRKISVFHKGKNSDTFDPEVIHIGNSNADIYFVPSWFTLKLDYIYNRLVD